MLKKRTVQLVAVCIVLGLASLAHAITMRVATNEGQATVTMEAVCAAAVTCQGSFSLNFGDGSAIQNSPVYSIAPGSRQSWVSVHTYRVGGDYTAKGSWNIVTTPPQLPYDVVKVISVMTVEPKTLEDAAVAEPYSVRFILKNGTPPLTFRGQSGSFPPGLRLDGSGTFKGTPTRLGRYRFTVLFGDGKGKKFTKEYELTVGTGDVSIRISPSSQRVTKQGVVASKLTYEYQGTAVQDTLRSPRGEFLVAGSTVGYNNRGLTLNVRNGKARSIESVTVPVTVIRRAEQLGVNKITYSRSFKSNSIIGKASCTFVLSAGGGDFRVTRMRVFFDNNRARKVVSRSSRDTSASVQINYIGTGLLKGFWEVDGRILQRVQKNIRFGKSITLKTPKVPPLPTFAEGTHRLRFVISDLDQNIKFPIAYYDVVENEKSRRSVVVILSPQDRQRVQLSEIEFSWKPREGAKSYLISFFDREVDDEKPVFSAYTKGARYELPGQVVEKHFQSGKRYDWLVLGLDEDGMVVSESRSLEFSVLHKE